MDKMPVCHCLIPHNVLLPGNYSGVKMDAKSCNVFTSHTGLKTPHTAPPESHAYITYDLVQTYRFANHA